MNSLSQFIQTFSDLWSSFHGQRLFYILQVLFQMRNCDIELDFSFDFIPSLKTATVLFAYEREAEFEYLSPFLLTVECEAKTFFSPYWTLN